MIDSFLKKAFVYFVDVAPFIMLGFSAISGFISSTDLYSHIFPFLGDSIGYSLATNLVFCKLYFRRQYCFPTKIAVIGLILMNLISMLLINTAYYNSVYDFWVAVLCIVVIITFKLLLWKF